MRLDRFLKVSRLIRRRSVAKEVADQGRILINDKVAKASSKVVQGDILTIRYGNRIMTVKVEQMKESTKRADATDMYELLNIEYIEENEL